jgi:hypothetical protein
MQRFLLGGLTAAFLLPAAAGAQTTVIETTAAAPPDEVITYVQRERLPSVRVEGDVAVGYTLPSTVQIRTIPQHDRYGYAVINERRVLVEPGTRRVIRVVE